MTKKLEPLECFVRSVDPEQEIIVNYNGNERLNIKKSTQKQTSRLTDGIENLLLI